MYSNIGIELNVETKSQFLCPDQDSEMGIYLRTKAKLHFISVSPLAGHSCLTQRDSQW